MMVHPLAGKPAPPEHNVNIPRLVTAYYSHCPASAVSFGTSGHRGSSLAGSFNEAHILAITQAVCDLRKAESVDGPLFMGMDTHALSEPAFVTALEVLAGNGVDVVIQQGLGYTPTPVISRAILAHNAGRSAGLADAIIITPSHNPPSDGGFKYNAVTGGPAAAETTGAIERCANGLLGRGRDAIRRIPYARALKADTTHMRDLVQPYIRDLAACVDLEIVRDSGIAMGADPMGGAAVGYWGPIAETYGLNIEVVNTAVDPTFGFMPLDHDGSIRMDCSSPYAMARLVNLRHKFDVAFGNDPDADRHGIVTRSGGLLSPNHFLAVAAYYLFEHRSGWAPSAAVAKTLVSSSMLDRLARAMDRPLVEVPVGFKWFVDGLLTGAFGFAGEESAGASFLCRDGSVWTTDKDGIALALLAAEITAATGRDPAEWYAVLESRFGRPVYQRIDTPATAAEKEALRGLSPEMVTASSLAGEAIEQKLTHAPGNGAAVGGLKITAANGWFCARPSGTEDLYKIYAESFLGKEHLTRIQEEARAIVRKALQAAGL